METIFDHSSYRSFLKNEYLREKTSSRKTTLSLYANQFGMSAAGLNMVLSGKRNLTIDSLHAVAQRLRLSKEEHEYFEAMVLRDQVRDLPSVRRYYDQKMKCISKKAPVKNIRISTADLISTWLTPALLIYLVDFELKGKEIENWEQLDLNKIARKFKMTIPRLKMVLEKFKKHGLLKTLPGKPMHVVFDKLVAHTPQKNYLNEVLSELALRIDRDFKNETSLYRGFVFTIEKSSLPDLRKELIALFERYMAETSEDPLKNVIVQSFTGLFAIT